MIEREDAARVVEALASNLSGVAKNPSNFEKLPDTFWGYFARGHDGKGKFAVIVTYSEEEGDVDSLLSSYQSWAAKHKVR